MAIGYYLVMLFAIPEMVVLNARKLIYLPATLGTPIWAEDRQQQDTSLYQLNN